MSVYLDHQEPSSSLSRAVFLSCLLGACCFSTTASADTWRINASLDYGEADSPLIINGAKTSFGFGALIPELVWTPGWLGSFGVGYGYGYGPDQEATLGPVSGRGDLESDVLQFTYSNRLDVTDRISLNVMYENRKYEVSGTLDGQFGSQTAPISVKSDIDFEEVGVRLAYSVREDLRLFAGFSQLDWQIDSDATARVGDNITAEVSVAGGDSTTQLSLGLDSMAFSRPYRLEVRVADLEADETITKVEVRLTTTLITF